MERESSSRYVLTYTVPSVAVEGPRFRLQNHIWSLPPCVRGQMKPPMVLPVLDPVLCAHFSLDQEKLYRYKRL